MVKAEWPQLSLGSFSSGMEGFSMKLKLLKEKVKSWTHAKALDMKDMSFLIENEINNILKSSPSGLFTHQINDRLQSLQA